MGAERVKGVVFAWGHVAEIASQAEQVGEFGERSQGDIKISPEFLLTALGGPFSDVRWNRDGGPARL